MNILSSWTERRAQQALDKILCDGIAWIDKQEEGASSYWFPSLFPGRIKAIEN